MELLDHNVIFDFLSYHIVFHSGCNFTLPPIGHKVSIFFTSLSKLVLFCFSDSQPNGCEVVLCLNFLNVIHCSYRRKLNTYELLRGVPLSS